MKDKQHGKKHINHNLVATQLHFNQTFYLLFINKCLVTYLAIGYLT